MKNSQHDIIRFWFEEIQTQQWFQVNEEFDALIKERFEGVYKLAAEGMCKDWEKDAAGCLALCIVLDQFPRNMYRGQAKAFQTDKQALLISKQAIHKGFDQILSPEKKQFLYMPYMHSENLNDQRKAVELYAGMQDKNPVAYNHAVRHFEEIEKFGRFPYRNKALGRDTTPEEELYLQALSKS